MAVIMTAIIMTVIMTTIVMAATIMTTTATGWWTATMLLGIDTVNRYQGKHTWQHDQHNQPQHQATGMFIFAKKFSHW